MKTRTEICIPSYLKQIGEYDSFFTIGSCFAHQMASFLTKSKFSVVNNPTGICYNPISIAKTIDMVLQNQSITKEDLKQNGDLFCHMDFHSDYSATAESKALQKMNQSIQNAHDQLAHVDVLILTLGTAWAYQEVTKAEVVNNCHKMPASNFERILLSQSLMEERLMKRIEQLIALRPEIKIIFTVSPIRHTKDGLTHNQLSKSKLVFLAHQLCEKFDQAIYFPSYEIMMDDLRDYRYYEEDLIHPNKQAFNYIKDLFVKSAMDESGQKFVLEMQQLSQDLNHRLLHPSSEASKQFLASTKKKIKALQLRYPKRNFDEDLNIVDQKA